MGRFRGTGYADLALATENVNRGQCEEGAVAVLRGGQKGVSAKPQLLTSASVGKPRQYAARFGESLAVGETNGDGVTDLLVMARGYHHPNGRNGFAAVLFGSANGPNGAKRLVWTNPNPANPPGFEDGALLDVDGDGRAEMLTTSYNEYTEPGYGALHVVKIGTVGGKPAAVAHQRVSGTSVGEWYGPKPPIAH